MLKGQAPERVEAVVIDEEVGFALLAFFVLMVRTYVAGMQIDCGCFGSGDALGPRTLLRDGLLLAASITLSVCAFYRSKPQIVS